MKMKSSSTEKNEPVLSPAERKIVKLLGRGLRNKEVATELSISPETVKSRRKIIQLKNDVGSIMELFHKFPVLLSED